MEYEAAVSLQISGFDINLRFNIPVCQNPVSLECLAHHGILLPVARQAYLGGIFIGYPEQSRFQIKIKTKMAFNLTKRQLVCFGSAGAVGIPAYLLTRGTLGNTGAMFLMLGIMLPAFLLAMYEKDGLPFEKVVRNIIRAKFLRPGIRAYRTENIYAPFAGPGAGKEDVIEKHKEEKRSRRQG